MTASSSEASLADPLPLRYSPFAWFEKGTTAVLFAGLFGLIFYVLTPLAGYLIAPVLLLAWFARAPRVKIVVDANGLEITNLLLQYRVRWSDIDRMDYSSPGFLYGSIGPTTAPRNVRLKTRGSRWITLSATEALGSDASNALALRIDLHAREAGFTIEYTLAKWMTKHGVGQHS